MNENLIKTLDLNDFKAGGEQKKTFVKNLRRIAKETGFFFLRNHNISQKALTQAGTLSKRFFTELTEEQRLRYEFIEEQHQFGYTPFGLEKGEYSDIPDTKCFWQAGNGDRKPPKVSEVPGFNRACMNLFREFNKTYIELMRAVALSLDLPEKYFDKKEGNSIMRSIYYPATGKKRIISKNVVRGGNYGGMCASKHTDINMLTLLHALSEGLQLRHKGKWIPVTIPDAELIIVNVGDMLEHLTGGLYKSGLHQVVCKRNVERFSEPFFGHVKRRTSIKPLTKFRNYNAKKYHFKTAGKYLNFRLKQIGL